jgi:ABC-type branched-subunit amino acid transport system substrate-binding protein
VGELPTEDCSPAYYEAVYIYKAAVEKVKSTKAEEVIKALEGMEFTGPTGKRKIRKDHFTDVEYIAVPELVKTDKYPFRVPGKTIKIPYEKVKFTSKELVEMGCTWCEGR